MTSPFLYLPGRRLSLAELAAARLDGDVIEVGDVYMPADAVETADLRAGSLLGLLGEGLAAVRLTAAWVHGGRDDPPARHAVQRTTSTRTIRHSTPRCAYHDVLLPARDVVRLSGAPVTTPVRTLADLVRSTDPEQRTAARSMVARRPELAAETLGWFEAHRGMPHARDGRALLRRLQEEVTR